MSCGPVDRQAAAPMPMLKKVITYCFPIPDACDRQQWGRLLTVTVFGWNQKVEGREKCHFAWFSARRSRPLTHKVTHWPGPSGILCPRNVAHDPSLWLHERSQHSDNSWLGPQSLLHQRRLPQVKRSTNRYAAIKGSKGHANFPPPMRLQQSA